MVKSTFDPLTNQIWQALKRECILVRGLLGSGITALGKATSNYLEGYYLAFFNLSIGVERLSKLVLIVNSKIMNNEFPSGKVMKGYNHNISGLLEEVYRIAELHDLQLLYPNEKNIISDAIISSLNHFADAQKGRYANIHALEKNKSNTEFEPIRWWSEKVDRLILGYHWKNTSKSKKLNNIATKIADQLNDSWFIISTNESGNTMNLEDIFQRSGSNKVLFKYRMYYTLVIIRSVSEIFNKLSQKNYLNEFSGLYEFFQGFCLNDPELLKYKKWPAF